MKKILAKDLKPYDEFRHPIYPHWFQVSRVRLIHTIDFVTLEFSEVVFCVAFTGETFLFNPTMELMVMYKMYELR